MFRRAKSILHQERNSRSARKRRITFIFDTLRSEDAQNLRKGVDTVIDITSIASNHPLTRPRHRLTDIATPIAAVTCSFPAVQGVPIPATRSLKNQFPLTCILTRHLNSFTQSRFRDCNLILLRFLGTTSSFLLCFNSLALTLINWLTGWNYLLVERPGLSVFHDRSKVNVFYRQKYSIRLYLKSQYLTAVKTAASRFLTNLATKKMAEPYLSISRRTTVNLRSRRRSAKACCSRFRHFFQALLRYHINDGSFHAPEGF